MGDTIVLEPCGRIHDAYRYLAGTKLSTFGVPYDNIYVVEEGPADVRTGACTILLSQFSTGLYLCYPGKDEEVVTYTSSQKEAANLQMLSCTENIPWSNCVSWTKDVVFRPGHEGEEPIANWCNPYGDDYINRWNNSVGFSYSINENSYCYFGIENFTDNSDIFFS